MIKHIGYEYTARGMKEIKSYLKRHAISYHTRADGVIEYQASDTTPSTSILVERALGGDE